MFSQTMIANQYVENIWHWCCKHSKNDENTLLTIYVRLIILSLHKKQDKETLKPQSLKYIICIDFLW